MLTYQCGQLINGVPEYCEACGECSSRCKQCKHWYDKEQVGPRGLCFNCELSAPHQLLCNDCGNAWEQTGITIQCPVCGMFNIFTHADHPFYDDIIEQAKRAFLRHAAQTPQEPFSIITALFK